MNQNFKLECSGKASLKSITSLHGDISRGVGSIRTVTLENRTMNTEQILGASSAVQESIDNAFGKTEHDAWVEANRKSGELKDDVLNMWGKNKDTSKRT